MGVIRVTAPLFCFVNLERGYSDMKMNKWILAGTALTGLFAAHGAFAQSTGTEAAEDVKEVVVQGKRGPRSIDGALTKESVGKSRSTVTQEYLETQASGQTVLQSINLVPGVNFTNNDAYGTSGGNIRIRGFDGNRISLTFDGAPLNDTGNYAIYSNQQLDSELIETVAVNLGTTDVDSPTASAAGGTVAYKTIRPSKDFGIDSTLSVGTENFRRAFVKVDTGEFLGFTAWVAASKTQYDKFKGPGQLEKTQYNGRIYRDLGNGDFLSLAANWNENRNTNYRNITISDLKTNPDLDYDLTCASTALPTPVNGTAQNAGSGCTNYYGQRNNPSNTGSVRGQFKKHITDSLVFTFDPSFQYVLANGGTQFEVVSEKDNRLDLDGTNTTGVGVDLNGDKDTLDSVMLFRPSNTNTRRFGLTSSLIWDLNDDHRLRGAYTIDYGRHRQTGEFSYMDASGNPVDLFGGKDGNGPAVVDVKGNKLQNRNRFSIAKLEQIAAEYRGYFFDRALMVNLGVRAPVLTRELNNYCYQPNGGDFPRCTAETPTVVAGGAGNVTFPTTGTTKHVPPISFTKEYKKTLPNVGVTWNFNDIQSLYVSYAEQISAPRTDNLYKYSRADTAGSPLITSIAEPETTQSFDFGYRYQSSNILLSAALWTSKFQNRIVQTYDPETLLNTDRNVGEVEMSGFDGQIGWQVADYFSVYASASYNKSELKEDLQLSATTFLPTKGKTLVETPEWTYSGRFQWEVTPVFQLGVQAKYVGERFTTDVNDEVAPAYTVFDMDMNYKISAFGKPGTELQLNVINMFDETYLGSLGSANNALPVTLNNGTVRNGSTTTHSRGAPRTLMLSLKTKF
jgi:iron complex outermembrane receptor protein